jgi:hypothetical protein
MEQLLPVNYNHIIESFGSFRQFKFDDMIFYPESDCLIRL